MAPLNFIEMPDELLLFILSLLDVVQILNLRQTCTKLSQITQDRSVWLAKFYQQQEHLPLPESLTSPDTGISQPSTDLSSSEIESGVRSAHRIAQLWTRPRKLSPVKLQPKSGNSLLGFEVFLDQWLLSAYSEGLVYLWDIKALSQTISPGERRITRCASLDLGSDKWQAFTAALGPSNDNVFFAITHGMLPIMTHIYRIDLRSGSIFHPNEFKLLYAMNHISDLTSIRTIEPTLQLIVLSSASSVDMVHWPSDAQGCGNLRTSMSISTDDMEEVWNGAIAVRVMGPYIVVFKLRSMLFCPFMKDGDQPFFRFPKNMPFKPDLPTLTHTFRSITFRYISCSDYLVSLDVIDPETAKTVQFNFFGYDVIQGIFHFRVRIRISSNPQLSASVDIDCVGVYPLSNNIDLSSLLPSPQSTTPDPSPLPPPIPTMVHMLNPGANASHPGIFGQATGYPGGNISSRGFLSAIALGSQGKRAVWVERKRGTMQREVWVWESCDQKEDGGIGGIEMQGHVVHEIGSYDLREDLTQCAIAEISGQIVLGNRMGDVFVMPLHD